MGHHSHSRLEATDVDVPVVPEEIGDLPDFVIVVCSENVTSLKGGP